MYPADELKHLALRKDLLRRRIALRRVVIILSGTRVVQPLQLADRALLAWKRLSPLLKLLAVPAGAVVGRGFRRRHGIVSRVIRWAPLVLRAWRGFNRGRAVAR